MYDTPRLQIAPGGFYYYGRAESEFQALSRLLEYHPRIAVDTETIAAKGDKTVQDGDERSTLPARTMIGCGIAISPDEAFYWPVGQDHQWANVPTVDIRPLIMKLSREAESKTFFNANFDLDRIEDRLDIKIPNYQDLSLWTRVQGLWNSLDALCGWLLGTHHDAIEDVLPKGKTMLDLPYPTTARKCINDCLDTFRLTNMTRLYERDGTWMKWQDHIEHVYDVTPGMQECYEVDLATVDLLRRMSKQGLRLRQDRLDYWDKRLTAEMEPFERQFFSIGFNPSSPVETGRILSERGNYLPPTQRTGKNAYKRLAVNEDVLLGLDDPLATAILHWRHRQHLRSHNITKYLGRERMPTHFRLDLSTGRLASYDDNSQNIPGENYQGLKPPGAYNMRDILAPDDPSDEFYWMDWSQAELRAFAFLTKDPVMLQEYKEGKNLHELMQQTLWPGTDKYSRPDLYTFAKAGNFQWIFDAEARTFAKNTRQPLSLCENLKSAFMTKYHVGRSWMLSQREQTGLWVANYYERRMHIPDGVYVTEEHKDKCRINWPVQGFVADIVKRGMLLADRMGAPMLIQCHDELVMDGPFDFGDPASGPFTSIHPELYLPFEIHHGRYWK